MTARPDAIVAVVLKGDRFLVIQRGPEVPDAGYWAPPTGKVEPGESQQAAVIREVREEVGLEVRPIRKVWECISAGGTHTLHWWLAEYVDGEVRLDAREVSGVRWPDLAEFGTYEQTFATDREFFRSVFPSLHLPGETYNG
jgi:8-oxo-dGTP diphosphatase